MNSVVSMRIACESALSWPYSPVLFALSSPGAEYRDSYGGRGSYVRPLL
jgi:hypothetical protein